MGGSTVNGKQACQGHSYDKATCDAVGCCRWNMLLGCRAKDADAQCYSDNPCDTTVAPGPSPPGPGKKSVIDGHARDWRVWNASVVVDHAMMRTGGSFPTRSAIGMSGTGVVFGDWVEACGQSSPACFQARGQSSSHLPYADEVP